MTSQEVKAMVAAGREYDDALKAFDAAIREKPDSKTEISEAFHALLAEHDALQAFGGVSTVLRPMGLKNSHQKDLFVWSPWAFQMS